MIPYFNDVERHGAVTLMSCEIVSECFLQHEKPELANEIYGFIHDEYNKFRISPQLTDNSINRLCIHAIHVFLKNSKSSLSYSWESKP